MSHEKIVLFEPCMVEHGDNKTRGMQIICGRCKNVGRIPFNTVAYGGERQAELILMRKFSNMGWVIGRLSSRHRCPTCVSSTKPLAAALSVVSNNTNHQKEHLAMAPTKIDSGVSPVALHNASREVHGLHRDDARVIYAKLDGVYLTERTGYSGGWTDARVSKDLGVPIEWVADVRERWFGPDSNVAATEQIAASKAVIAECEVALAKGNELIAMMATLQTTLDQHRSDLAALEQSLKVA